MDAHFEIVKPPPPSNQIVAVHPPRIETRRRGLSVSQHIISDSPTEEMSFTRRPLPPARLQTSALTTMLASSGKSSNPFSELYAAISGRGEAAAIDVKIFFPHAAKPHGEGMVLSVRKDATVEEVIGFALWSYWEESWLPNLDAGIDENDPTLSAIGWVMRIAEDDGEVDEDFPRKHAVFCAPAYFSHLSVHSTRSYRQDCQVQIRCLRDHFCQPNSEFVIVLHDTSVAHVWNSPTERAARMQDPAPPVTYHCCSREGGCRAWKRACSSNCSSTRREYAFWSHARALLFSWAFCAWPTHIPAYQGFGHC